VNPLRWLWRLYVEQVLCFEGSTRPVSLLRIAIALLMWSRYAGHTAHPALAHTPDIIALNVLFWVSTTAMLLGFQSRWAAGLAGVAGLAQFYWQGLHLGVEALHVHHVYTLGITAALLAATPCGGSFSVDRWLALRRAESRGEAAPPEWGPLWGQRIIAVMVCVMYLGTAYEKSYWHYLNGNAMEMAYTTLYLGSDVPMPPVAKALTAASSGVVWALEWLLPITLWFRRFRWVSIGLGVLMHAGMYILIPVATFSLTMCGLYLMFLDPDEVHRHIDRALS